MTRSRVIYQLGRYRGRKGEIKAFTWTRVLGPAHRRPRQLPGGNAALMSMTS